MRPDRLRDKRIESVTVRDVEHRRCVPPRSFSAKCRDDHRRLIDVGANHAGAFLRQTPCDPPAKAPRGARNDRNFSRQLSHRVHPVSVLAAKYAALLAGIDPSCRAAPSTVPHTRREW